MGKISAYSTGFGSTCQPRQLINLRPNEAFQVDMDKNAIYDIFIEGMINCSLQQELSLQIIEAQRENIKTKYKDLIEKNQIDKPISTNNLVFYSWENNQGINYGTRDTTIIDLWGDTIFYHNKIYQWLLVTAFEAYEKYLKEISRIIFKGECINSASKALKRIRNKFSTYRDLERRTHVEVNMEIIKHVFPENIQNKIIVENRYSKKYKEIFTKDTNNVFQLALIEEMRHHIVHNNGRVPDKDKFLEKILIDIGLYNNGKYDKTFEDIVNSYFSIKYPDEITLLEIPIEEFPGFSARTDVLFNLFQVLLNSVYYINKEL